MPGLSAADAAAFRSGGSLSVARVLKALPKYVVSTRALASGLGQEPQERVEMSSMPRSNRGTFAGPLAGPARSEMYLTIRLR